MSIFPSGDYKIIAFVYGKNVNDPVAAIEAAASVVSPNKDTFG